MKTMNGRQRIFVPGRGRYLLKQEGLSTLCSPYLQPSRGDVSMEKGVQFCLSALLRQSVGPILRVTGAVPGLARWLLYIYPCQSTATPRKTTQSVTRMGGCRLPM